MAKILKVGFDLDGVILYNPARVLRPVVVQIKKRVLKRSLGQFYYPKNVWEQFVWNILHKSSVWPAPGTKLLLDLAKRKKINAYIISGRYESLKTDFKRWINKIDPNGYFSGHYYNETNDQPHLYKERMIKKLALDIYVEDNWDIVTHLTQNLKVPPKARLAKGGKSQNCKIFWIYNILDRNISYKYKFAGLKQVLLYVTRYTLHSA